MIVYKTIYPIIHNFFEVHIYLAKSVTKF